MKFIKLLLIAFFFSPLTLNALAHFNDFANNVSEQNIKAFSKDLAGLLGSNTYTTGRILGWGGFQLSARAAFMPKPSKDNTALGNNSDGLIMPFVQGEIGLPFRLDGYIRAISYDGLTIAGGGLKWGITRPLDEDYSFQAMIVTLAQSGVHKDFSLTHYNADLVFSFKMPIFTPYIGGGIDYINTTVESAKKHPEMLGKNAYTTTARATLGVNIQLPSYLDLSLAANWTHYKIGYEASFGVRF